MIYIGFTQIWHDTRHEKSENISVSKLETMGF